MRFFPSCRLVMRPLPAAPGDDERTQLVGAAMPTVPTTKVRRSGQPRAAPCIEPGGAVAPKRHSRNPQPPMAAQRGDATEEAMLVGASSMWAAAGLSREFLEHIFAA